MNNYSPNQVQSLDEILDKCAGHIKKISYRGVQRDWCLIGWIDNPKDEKQVYGKSIRGAVNTFYGILALSKGRKL